MNLKILGLIVKPKERLLWSKNSLENGRARREKTSSKVIKLIIGETNVVEWQWK